MFPALDMRSISSLWVYRLVTARGTRRAEVPEMLDGPLDPGAITSDAMLRNYGPGVIRLVARSHNGGIIGHPITMRFPDERGHVPVLPEEFSNGASETAPVAPPDPVRLELQFLKERFEQERGDMARRLEQDRLAWKEIIAEERAQRRADTDSLVKLTERVLDAQKAMAPAAAQEAPRESGRSDPWVRQEFQRVSKELEKAQKELVEHKERFFKLQTKKGDASDEWNLEKMMMMAKFMKEFMQEGGGAAPSSATPAAAPAIPEGFMVFAGEVVPTLELLDAAIKGEGGDVAKALNEDGLATFKRLHAKGMLPRSYEQRLSAVLGPLG